MNSEESQKEIFYSIGEVAKITQLEPYILRYWEKEFSELSPVKRESRHRRYTQKDIDVIMKIKKLRYEEKYTIEGVKAVLLEEKRKGKQLDLELNHGIASIDVLKQIKQELKKVKQILESEK